MAELIDVPNSKVCLIGEWSIFYMHSKVGKNFSCLGKNLMKHRILLIMAGSKGFCFCIDLP